MTRTGISSSLLFDLTYGGHKGNLVFSLGVKLLKVSPKPGVQISLPLGINSEAHELLV